MRGKDKNGNIVEASPEETAAEIASYNARLAAVAAAKSDRDARLADIPANEQSMVALRNKVNAILAELRGE